MPLGAAAGDVAGGADPVGYSAITQVAIAITYHLLRHQTIHREPLMLDLAELDGGVLSSGAYRHPLPGLARWLVSLRGGQPLLSGEVSSEPAGGVAAIGVWFRRDPDQLVQAVIEASLVTDLDAGSAVAAAAVAGAVAGGCFAMSGLDLVRGAAETAERAASVVAATPDRFTGAGLAGAVPAMLRAHARVVREGPEAIVAVVKAAEVGPLEPVLLGILLGGGPEPVAAIEAAAVNGGSLAGSITGAVVGARVGLRRWPWKVPNETWFAELGRRLVDHVSEVRDLPVPFAVEIRMTEAARTTR